MARGSGGSGMHSGSIVCLTRSGPMVCPVARSLNGDGSLRPLADNRARSGHVLLGSWRVKHGIAEAMARVSHT